MSVPMSLRRRLVRRRASLSSLFTWILLLLQILCHSEAWSAPAPLASSVRLTTSSSYGCRTLLLSPHRDAPRRDHHFRPFFVSAETREQEIDHGSHDGRSIGLLTSRRRWLQGAAASGSAAIVAIASSSSPSSALARSAPATASSLAPPTPPAVVTSVSTCDPTVSVWKRGNRIVYLLGTAHISESSASLARNLVKEVHPNAVFVELDLKRIGGLANTQPKTESGAASRGAQSEGEYVPPPQPSRILIPAVATAGTTGVGSNTATTIGVPVGADATMATAVTSSGSLLPSSEAAGGAVAPSAIAPRPAQGGFGLDLGAAAVGKAIQGMYKNLNQAGFNPGEEFVEAVREGRRIGADIVLGDRDVQVTLRRLVQALQSTDMSALMDPNSELERSMSELLPGGGQYPADPASYKEEVSAFVESIKSRDRVRSIIGQLRKVAPALVEVMLTERDSYMAAGLDSLNQYLVMVAVMGMAHQDGVEQNLSSVGWKQVKPRCRNGEPI